jgi:hypothetical protein
MNLDDLKSAWQAQSAAPLKVDAAFLLKELHRNEQSFQRTLWLRDVGEIAVAIALIPVWLVMGSRLELPWTWYLMVPSLLWVAGFMWVDRVQQRRHRSQPDDTLRQSVERSLAQVEHQIWLLRNVVWWYLLPLVAPMAIFLAHTGAERRAWEGGAYPTTLVVVGLVTGGVWWLNRRAVRAELEPRRRELEALLNNLAASS